MEEFKPALSGNYLFDKKDPFWFRPGRVFLFLAFEL
jgi:hypothetical protein